MNFMPNTALTIILVTLATSLTMAYAETFSYCQENTTHSQSWQKQICFESLICTVPTPIINYDSKEANFDYTIHLIQSKIHCKHNYHVTNIVILPYSFHLKIFDDEFNYLVYDDIVTDQKDISLKLHKDIQYRLELETIWHTDNIKNYQFIEDDYNNLIKEKPYIHIQKTEGIILIPFDLD